MTEQEQVAQYKRYRDEREAMDVVDKAWDALIAAEHAGKPISECEHLYDVYLNALNEYAKWSRNREREAVR